ncbi:MAG: hypothetical protein U0165_14070 [Polyangiaceae bacterium]
MTAVLIPEATATSADGSKNGSMCARSTCILDAPSASAACTNPERSSCRAPD